MGIIGDIPDAAADCPTIVRGLLLCILPFAQTADKVSSIPALYPPPPQACLLCGGPLQLPEKASHFIERVQQINRRSAVIADAARVIRERSRQLRQESEGLRRETRTLVRRGEVESEGCCREEAVKRIDGALRSAMSAGQAWGSVGSWWELAAGWVAQTRQRWYS